MKKWLLLVLVSLAALSCKVQQKSPASQLPAEPNNVVGTKTDLPIVNSISGKYNLIDSSQVRVFLQTNITSLGQSMSLKSLNENFRIQWQLVTDMGIREKIQSGHLSFTQDFVSIIDGYQYINFDIPRPQTHNSATLIIEFLLPSGGTKYTFDIPVDFQAKRTNTRFLVYDKVENTIPRFTPYLTQGTDFVIKSINPSSEPLYLIRYKNNSKPALSPMSGTVKDLLTDFEIIESITVKDREILNLIEEGLYVLTQTPENLTDGYSFLVVNHRYPRNTNPETLAEALVYMSTSKETEALKTNLTAKDGMDMYFLNLAKGDQELARKIIRTYYNRIEEANELFTSFKEGWKTDKGMVYIVMGPPTRVQKNRTREVWLYPQNRNSSEIIYTFYNKPNVFADQNFDLVRYPEYSAFWYPYVEAWRTGKIAE